MNDAMRQERKRKAWSALSADLTSQNILHHFLRWANGHPEGFRLKDALDDEKFRALRPAEHRVLVQRIDEFLPLLQDASWPSTIEVTPTRSPLAAPDDTTPISRSGPMLSFDALEEIPEAYRADARVLSDGRYTIALPAEVLALLNPKPTDDPKSPRQYDEGKSPFALTRDEARDVERYREVRARAAAAGKCVEITG